MNRFLQKTKRLLINSLLPILAGLILVVALSYAAFQEPLQPPPLCNPGDPGCDAPINVSINAQAKEGSLIVGNNAAMAGIPSLIARYGNVGIGTTSPGQKLDVVGGNIRSNTGFCIGASCITSWPAGGGVGGNGAANKVAFWTAASTLGYNNNFHWDNINQRLGIGTASPSAKLDIAGQTRIYRNNLGTLQGHATLAINENDNPEIWMEDIGNNTGGLGILGSNWMVFGTERNISFKTNSSFAGGMSSGDDRLVIMQGGNVGIGTTNPQDKLDVAGKIRVSDISGTAGSAYLCRNTSNQIAGCSGTPGEIGDVYTVSCSGNMGCTTPNCDPGDQVLGGGSVGSTTRGVSSSPVGDDAWACYTAEGVILDCYARCCCR